MKTVFTISLVLLFFNFYSISVLPYNNNLRDVIFFIHLFLFLILFASRFRFISFANYSLPKINILSIIVSLIFFSFIYSNFIQNLGTNNTLAYFKLLSYPILIYIYLFCLSEYLLSDDVLFEKFLNIVLLFAIANSIAAIIFNVLGMNENPNFPYHILGFFNHPNTGSNIYTIAVPILFYKYFKGKLHSLVFALLLILYSYCLVFSFSRAGYLGTALGILLITFFKSKKIFFITLSGIFIVSFFFIFGVASSKTNSSFARILLIYTAYDMILQNTGSFLWGYGVYNSIEIFKNEKVFFGSYENAVDPHNTILLLGIQFGMIVSGLTVLLVFITSIKATLKRKLLSTAENAKVNLLITLIIAILFQNMLEDILVYPEFFIMPLFLTFFGILLKYNELKISRA